MYVQQTVIKDDTAETGNHGYEDGVQDMDIQRDTRDAAEIEGERPSEQKLGNKGGSHGCRHGRQQHYSGKIPVQFF